jgi:hypothetical protein
MSGKQGEIGSFAVPLGAPRLRFALFQSNVIACHRVLLVALVLRTVALLESAQSKSFNLQPCEGSHAEDPCIRCEQRRLSSFK